MTTNLNRNEVIQTYFDITRPRTTLEVCVNILKTFYTFGFKFDFRITKTKNYIVQYFNNNVCLIENRHYFIFENFLYFTIRLNIKIFNNFFRKRLHTIKRQLQKKLNVSTNSLILAFRFFACQLMRIDSQLYKKNLKKLISLQIKNGE